jgi:diaminohydroxyphosphoribosylaminopyrimidine deaminase/5-amino-6-(5-phosphoribosylamino)uracil reductase
MKQEDFILKTFELAKLGKGMTWPNPLVGAVIVKDGRIIGSGYHHQHGLDHAEVDALKNCTESPVGATVYVNLEPCCHTNKQTPPCAQRLITEKIKKVVICNLDPNPSVNGQGVALLRANGIEVEHGILEEEGEKLNEVFFFAQRNKKPFIHLKLATTLDGMTAMPNGESKWITGEKSREYVHELRSLHQGVIAGAETIRLDDPKLNVRLPHFTGKQPQRIIFSRTGKLPPLAKVFTDELKQQTLIYTVGALSFDFPSENIIRIDSLKEAMSDLFSKKMINLFLEGGSNLATSFIKDDMVNRVSLFMNPSFLGNGKNALSDLGLTKLDDRPFLKQTESRWIDGDLLISGRLK